MAWNLSSNTEYAFGTPIATSIDGDLPRDSRQSQESAVAIFDRLAFQPSDKFLPSTVPGKAPSTTTSTTRSPAQVAPTLQMPVKSPQGTPGTTVPAPGSPGATGDRHLSIPNSLGITDAQYPQFEEALGEALGLKTGNPFDAWFDKRHLRIEAVKNMMSQSQGAILNRYGADLQLKENHFGFTEDNQGVVKSGKLKETVDAATVYRQQYVLFQALLTANFGQTSAAEVNKTMTAYLVKNLKQPTSPLVQGATALMDGGIGELAKRGQELGTTLPKKVDPNDVLSAIIAQEPELGEGEELAFEEPAKTTVPSAFTRGQESGPLATTQAGGTDGGDGKPPGDRPVETGGNGEEGDDEENTDSDGFYLEETLGAGLSALAVGLSGLTITNPSLRQVILDLAKPLLDEIDGSPIFQQAFNRADTPTSPDERQSINESQNPILRKYNLLSTAEEKGIDTGFNPSADPTYEPEIPSEHIAGHHQLLSDPEFLSSSTLDRYQQGYEQLTESYGYGPLSFKVAVAFQHKILRNVEEIYLITEHVKQIAKEEMPWTKLYQLYESTERLFDTRRPNKSDVATLAFHDVHIVFIDNTHSEYKHAFTQLSTNPEIDMQDIAKANEAYATQATAAFDSLRYVFSSLRLSEHPEDYVHNDRILGQLISHGIVENHSDYEIRELLASRKIERVKEGLNLLNELKDKTTEEVNASDIMEDMLFTKAMYELSGMDKILGVLDQRFEEYDSDETDIWKAMTALANVNLPVLEWAEHTLLPPPAVVEKYMDILRPDFEKHRGLFEQTANEINAAMKKAREQTYE